jgi:hypothetical protein|tara:strand:+ start:1788 stop:2279 length:492 start_codon:yes stop_codon:yes gene_type:complete
MENFKTYGQFVNENAKKFKQFWDKGPETGIRKKFGKDYDKAVGNRVDILLSLTDNPDKAENWATMDFLQLPNGISTQLLNMDPKEIDRILDESIKENSNTIANLNKMALTDLERICDYANMIKDRMTQGQELDAWMYSKISDSVKNLNSVHDTMDGKDGTTEE